MTESIHNPLNLLLVFVKNPQLGKVKTRLAATVGNEEALRIYQLLFQHTAKVATSGQWAVAVYYSDFIPQQPDAFLDVARNVQQGADLGMRMQNAFDWGFAAGYKQIVIVGSDCPALSTQHLEEAFAALHAHADVVMGPAQDGGYYLLGMKQLHKTLFQNKPWSTDLVAAITKQDCAQLHLNITLLPVLNDVDDEEDWKEVEDFF
jgi:hypothetical protein